MKNRSFVQALRWTGTGEPSMPPSYCSLVTLRSVRRPRHLRRQPTAQRPGAVCARQPASRRSLDLDDRVRRIRILFLADSAAQRKNAGTELSSHFGSLVAVFFFKPRNNARHRDRLVATPAQHATIPMHARVVHNVLPRMIPISIWRTHEPARVESRILYAPTGSCQRDLAAQIRPLLIYTRRVCRPYLLFLKCASTYFSSN